MEKLLKTAGGPTLEKRSQVQEAKVKAGELVRGGMFIKQAAEATGLSITTVHHWCVDRGIPRPKAPRSGRPRGFGTPQDIRDKAVEMVRGGKSYNEVGEILVYSSECIRGWCKTAGVESTYKRKGSRGIRAKWALEADWTKSDSQLAFRLEISRQRVHQMRRRVGGNGK